MSKDLKSALLAWDGIHMDYLVNIYNDFNARENFFKSLVKYASQEPSLQTAVTWLIKHHYDLKNTLTEVLLTELLQNANKMVPWEAKLHILQILPRVNIPINALIPIDDLVKKGLQSKNKFVRAWSFQGFYELTKSIPEYKDELKLLCNDALLVESPSVKVRVRKILESLDNKAN